MEPCGFVDDIQMESLMESMVGGTFWQLHSWHEMSAEFGCERYVFHSLETYTSKAYITWMTCLYQSNLGWMMAKID